MSHAVHDVTVQTEHPAIGHLMQDNELESKI